MSNKYRLIIASLLTALSVTAMSALGQDKTETPKTTKLGIILSKETTYITGPVNEDGTVNYVAYLNEKYSKGVTPENNAAIPMLKVFGPEMIPEEVRAKVFKTLKLKALPEKGNYFVTFNAFLESRGLDEEQIEAAKDDLAEAMVAPWQAKQYPQIAAWLKASKAPLEILTTGSKRTRYYMPLLSPDEPPAAFSMILIQTHRLRDSAKALTARAMLKLESDDFNGARADLMTVGRLARMVGQGPTFIDRLVGLSIGRTRCSAMDGIVSETELSDEKARVLLADMDSLAPLPDIREAIGNERSHGLDSVMILARGDELTVFELIAKMTDRPLDTKASRAVNQASRKVKVDWNIVLRVVNKWYDKAEAVAATKTVRQRRAAHDALEKEKAALSAKLLKSIAIVEYLAGKNTNGSPKKDAPPADPKVISEAVGRLLVQMLMPSLDKAVTLQEQHAMNQDLLRVSLALAAERARTGKYPDKLSALSPGYLKAIPKDIFSGKELIYKPARHGREYLLYSVGMNLKDDGGKDEDEDQDDLTVRGK